MAHQNHSKRVIYLFDRREIGTLLLIGILTCFFTFTLGIHYSKDFNQTRSQQATLPISPIQPKPDQVPSAQELAENAKGSEEAVNEILNQSLHEEVSRMGLRLEKTLPVRLPASTKVKEAGQTQVAKVAEVESKPDRSGKHTIYLGSYQDQEEAKMKMNEIKSFDQNPVLKQVHITHKGTFYNIHLGEFNSYEDADNAASYYQKKGKIKNYRIVPLK